MAKMDDRMELIGSAILSQAQQEARDLIDKANETREREISRCEEEIVDGMFGKVQGKATHIRLESMKTTARDQLEAHRTLLMHRTRKTDAVFASVKARLIEYAKTPEYKESLLKLAAVLKDKYDHSTSTVFVSEADIELGGQIAEALGSTNVKADSTIKIGGFKLRNSKSGILVDETLDECLDEQKPWFLQSCGLKIM